jgi:F-type H+-transporting ATPase subunit a
MIVGFLVDLVEGTGGKTIGRRILPLISGIFIFILFANFSGLIPGMGTVGVYREHAVEAEHATTDEHAATDEEAAADEAVNGEEHEKALVPFFRAPTADLNMTLALSVLAFVSIQIAGIKSHGVVGRIKHMANPPFLFPIEVISELSRILSLAARLFGNVFAGEVLLGVMFAMGAAIKIAIVPFLFPVVFLGLEVLFGTIQALVFALLTHIYIMLAAAHEEHHDEASPEHAPEGAHGVTPAAVASGD